MEYTILDEDFGQPSPANWCDTEYAIEMRRKSDIILQDLVNEGLIEIYYKSNN